ncbi:MAG: succinate dehydrogenase assembly factor 2 [Pseudomonadota bacterium]
MSDEAEMSRLLWRCRRGMLELDLLLLAFLENGYERLEGDQRDRFSRLLELPDQTLLESLMGDSAVEQKEFADVIKRIRHATAHRGRC